MESNVISSETLLGTAPLTRSQLGIWSGQAMAPQSPLYNMVLSFTIFGKVKEALFQEAFDQTIYAFDVLRMVVRQEEGLPKQYFYTKVNKSLILTDFSKEPDPEGRYQEFIETHKKKVFHDGELLYESHLVKLGEQKYAWFLNLHHLITDGFSMILMYSSVNEYYHAALTKSSNGSQESVKPEFRIYASSSQEDEENLPFWEALEKESWPRPVFYGQRQQTDNTSKSTRITVDLGQKRTEALTALAKRPGIKGWNIDTSLQQIFLTALNVLIYKISGQSDFMTGLVSHNRLNKIHKTTGGLFMEIYPLANTVASEESFLRQFEKVRDTSFEMMKAVAQAKPPVGLLRQINVLLNFIPMPLPRFGDAKVHTDWVLSDYVDPAHHIRLQVQDFDNEGSFKLQFDLNNDLFDERLRNNLPQHFVNVLDAFLASPEQLIRDVSVITAEEETIIKEINKTDKVFSPGETLLTQFSTQVHQTPAATALIFDGQKLTYAEFDKRINQLANQITSSGVAPKDVVAVMIDRSFEMMVAIYAVLRAGAVYLPMATDTPLDRKKFMLVDAEVKALLRTGEIEEDLTTVQQILVDFLELDRQSEHFEQTQPAPEDPAYIIYTSGSTGRPKGVKCHHQGICNRLNWMESHHPLDAKDVLIQKTPYTFDVSLWELFWPLQRGASLVIEKPEGHKDTAVLIDSINAEQVTIIHFVPSMLELFLEDPKVNTCTSLTHVFCSGEALTPTLVKRFYTIFENAALINNYGPTEASVEVSTYTCPKESNLNTVPIGKPGANVSLYILDEGMNPSPLGALGELYIGGVQVASGYLNREELTAERFVNHAVLQTKSEMLYKTGDVVRYNSAGEIEYHGRVDDQIKLRGFRIELGEIEVSIQHHPEVIQAAVILLQDEVRGKYLVAYYTGKPIDHPVLKAFLESQLPEYMVPAFFIHLDQFPLSGSGKINKRQLPHPMISASDEPREKVPADNDLESMILEIWIAVLKHDGFGVTDAFIQAGGDSLRALAITARIREVLALDITPDKVLIHNTVRSYAAHVEQRMIEIMANEEEDE